MLSNDQVRELESRLNKLTCVSPDVGNELFAYVFLGEPPSQRPQIEAHLPQCDHCRIALKLFRYQRDSGKILVEYLELGKKTIEEARCGNAAIETKPLASGRAYFRPPEHGALGLTVIVNANDEIISVEEQSREDFEKI
jgi:hypothetical protein